MNRHVLTIKTLISILSAVKATLLNIKEPLFVLQLCTKLGKVATFAVDFLLAMW